MDNTMIDIIIEYILDEHYYIIYLIALSVLTLHNRCPPPNNIILL